MFHPSLGLYFSSVIFLCITVGSLCLLISSHVPNLNAPLHFPCHQPYHPLADRVREQGLSLYPCVGFPSILSPPLFRHSLSQDLIPHLLPQHSAFVLPSVPSPQGFVGSMYVTVLMGPQWSCTGKDMRPPLILGSPPTMHGSLRPGVTEYSV